MVCRIDCLFPLALSDKIKVHLAWIRMHYSLTKSTLINKEVISYLCGYPVVCLAVVGFRGQESPTWRGRLCKGFWPLKNLINARGPMEVEIFVSFIHLFNKYVEQVFW